VATFFDRVAPLKNICLLVSSLLIGRKAWGVFTLSG
jgi:hypothetical protein